MSDFSAKIIARLDPSKIPTDLKKIEASEIKLNNLTFNTQNLLSQIQSSLDKHKFTINLDGIKINNAGNQVGSGIKRTINDVKDAYKETAKLQYKIDSIKLKIDTGDINKQLSSVETKYKSLASTGHSSLTTINGDIDYLKTLQKSMNSQTGDELVKSYENWDKTLKRVQNNLIIVSNESKQMVTSLQVVTLDNKMSKWLEKNTKASKEFGGSIEILKEKLHTAFSSGSLDSVGLKEIENEFRKIDQEAEKAGKKGKSFVSTFGDAFRSISNYISVSAVIHETINGLRQMYQNVYQVDTAMVNLKKVTEESSATYNKFLKDSAKNAKDLGRNISSYITQTSEWAKLGYSLKESESLSKISSIYANVGEVEDETAVSDMVTGMKAFNIEANSAITIVDSLNELGNKFATSAASLGTGLSNSASAMSTAGTDLYKTLAILTGGAEITQDAGEFGNFLKTSSMRIRGMKGELEELGEEVDESVDSISKVQTQILNLTKGEVNIFDNKGEFRDYYEIMKDISEVVNDLSSTDKASLYEILFGKQRGNQGAALIQAFQSGQIEKAYEAALNSEGSAMAEQEKWLDSLEAKTQQFNAAWQELSNTVLDEDILKFFVELGTTGVSGLAELVDTFGTLNVLLAGGGIIAFFKNLD